MRLLVHNNDGKFSLTKDFGNDTPQYAIVSHTWGPDTEEVTFRDLMNGSGMSKVGYHKIRFCGEQARRDGLRYFWVDTCCIDKSNNNELSEAINSMFRWSRKIFPLAMLKRSLRVVENLGYFFERKGDTEKARIMYLKALAGFEVVGRADDPRCQVLRNRICALDVAARNES